MSATAACSSFWKPAAFVPERSCACSSATMIKPSPCPPQPATSPSAAPQPSASGSPPPTNAPPADTHPLGFVILSEGCASRSEAQLQSKDPCLSDALSNPWFLLNHSLSIRVYLR